MPEKPLFPAESPVVQRQPKTDRLILERFLRPAANDKRLEESELQAAHAVLVKWADLDSSGRLAKLNETQMQGTTPRLTRPPASRPSLAPAGKL